jgi:hypothetical protein
MGGKSYLPFLIKIKNMGLKEPIKNFNKNFILYNEDIQSINYLDYVWVKNSFRSTKFRRELTDSSRKYIVRITSNNNYQHQCLIIGNFIFNNKLEFVAYYDFDNRYYFCLDDNFIELFNFPASSRKKSALKEELITKLKYIINNCLLVDCNDLSFRDFAKKLLKSDHKVKGLKLLPLCQR